MKFQYTYRMNTFVVNNTESVNSQYTILGQIDPHCNDHWIM